MGKCLMAIASIHAFCFSEPVVLVGKMVPAFVGKPIKNIRIIDHTGACIPFQIDEIDSAGDYICPSGKEPNAGNGILDTADEIVFLWEDADTVQVVVKTGGEVPVSVSHDASTRHIGIVSDSSLPLSNSSYIAYDPARKN